ncbi:MAG: hypothetical protein KF744_05250 [Taibaiella sp.]|nr:hypothetical protein [Taibaiella sp.]
MFRSCLLILLFIAHSCSGQEGSARSQFNHFKKNILEELRVHPGYIRSSDYETLEAYYTLLSSQPIDSLIGFTDDSVPAVRSLIFDGITKKNADEKIIKEILKRHAEDTAKFTSISVDIVSTWSVSQYMETSAYRGPDNKPKTVDFRARLEEIKKRRPYNLVPGARHGIIPKDSLLRLSELPSPIEGFRITSFRVSILKAKEDIEVLSEGDSTFTKQMKERIETLSSGDRIFIEDVKAKGPDNKERQLGSVVLFID